MLVQLYANDVLFTDRQRPSSQPSTLSSARSVALGTELSASKTHLLNISLRPFELAPLQLDGAEMQAHPTLRLLRDTLDKRLTI